MRISYIKEFIAFTKRLNISAAARDLSMSQPNLSRHLSEMEKELGTMLFDRKPKVQLTSAGIAFLSEALKVEAAYDRTIEECVQVSQADSDGNKLYIQRYERHNASSKANMRIFLDYRSQHPEINIEFLTLYKNTPEKALASGFLDVAQSASFDRPDDICARYAMQGLSATPLLSESVVVWMSEGNPLAKVEQVTMDAILEKPILVTSALAFNPLSHALNELASARNTPLSFKHVSVNNWLDFFLSGDILDRHSVFFTTDEYDESFLQRVENRIVRRNIGDDRMRLTTFLLMDPANGKESVISFASYLASLPVYGLEGSH